MQWPGASHCPVSQRPAPGALTLRLDKCPHWTLRGRRGGWSRRGLGIPGQGRWSLWAQGAGALARSSWRQVTQAKGAEVMGRRSGGHRAWLQCLSRGLASRPGRHAVRLCTRVPLLSTITEDHGAGGSDSRQLLLHGPEVRDPRVSGLVSPEASPWLAGGDLAALPHPQGLCESDPLFS